MLNNLHIALRSLFKKGRNNIIKIVSLGIGLAVGLVLVSKVYFDLSYDGFYPDHERIYLLQQNYRIGDDKKGSSNTVSGGIAPGMKAEIPEVEAATRFDYVGDFTFITADYISLMNMQIVQGNNFVQTKTDSLQVMVSQLMADKLAAVQGWSDGVVGKYIRVSGHDGDQYTIVGVYDNIHISSLANRDENPSAIFYSAVPSDILLVKLHQLTSENRASVENVIRQALPDYETEIRSYKADMVNLYRSSRLFRDAILIGGCVILALLLIGLIGYVNDEINRRNKEIALRKINGATSKEILSLISFDVAYIAVPTVVMGVGISYFVGEKWLEQFADKIGLSPSLFIFSTLSVLVIILATILIRSWKAANDNPVESLKSE